MYLLQQIFKSSNAFNLPDFQLTLILRSTTTHSQLISYSQFTTQMVLTHNNKWFGLFVFYLMNWLFSLVHSAALFLRHASLQITEMNRWLSASLLILLIPFHFLVPCCCLFTQITDSFASHLEAAIESPTLGQHASLRSVKFTFHHFIRTWTWCVWCIVVYRLCHAGSSAMMAISRTYK